MVRDCLSLEREALRNGLIVPSLRNVAQNLPLRRGQKNINTCWDAITLTLVSPYERFGQHPTKFTFFETQQDSRLKAP